MSVERLDLKTAIDAARQYKASQVPVDSWAWTLAEHRDITAAIMKDLGEGDPNRCFVIYRIVLEPGTGRRQLFAFAINESGEPISAYNVGRPCPPFCNDVTTRFHEMTSI